MKLAVPLLTLALLPLSVYADASQAPDSSATITVTRTADGKGYDIVLSPEAVKKTAIDQLWLVVDGKSEGFGGGYYNAQTPEMPLRYTANINGDLDGNVKDILKAQGFPVKANVTTYRISLGVNRADGGSISQTLHFRQESNILAFTQFPATTTYNVGDKIPIFGAITLDESLTMSHIFGIHNEVLPQFSHLPNDLLHRITIQVQFVPKTMP